MLCGTATLILVAPGGLLATLAIEGSVTHGLVVARVLPCRLAATVAGMSRVTRRGRLVRRLWFYGRRSIRAGSDGTITVGIGAVGNRPIRSNRPIRTVIQNRSVRANIVSHTVARSIDLSAVTVIMPKGLGASKPDALGALGTRLGTRRRHGSERLPLAGIRRVVVSDRHGLGGACRKGQQCAGQEDGSFHGYLCR
jgi:hypothetical protein